MQALRRATKMLFFGRGNEVAQVSKFHGGQGYHSGHWLLLEELQVPWRHVDVNIRDCMQWMLFQASHVGPMIGQANHFNNHTDVQYGKDRYNLEVARLYRVIDTRLADSEWMAAGGYGIADIALHPWLRNRKNVQVDASSHPNLMRWFEAAPVTRRILAGELLR